MLLEHDHFIKVLPSLAVAMGLDEALIIQHLHFCTNCQNSGKVIDGHKWVFNTYEQWQKDHFPWWPVIHIRRLFSFLENIGIIVSCQPEGRMSRRKYYRLNQAMVEKLRKGDFPAIRRVKRIAKPRNPDAITTITSCDHQDHMDRSLRSLPITESTLKEYETKSTSESQQQAAEARFSEFPPIRKPEPGTKEEKLARIIPPPKAPTETEFDDFLCKEDTHDIIYNYRPDLYSQLCESKWHQWQAKLQKWVPIRNWQKYVLGLVETISDAKGKGF